MSEFVLNSKDIQMNVVNCRLFELNWANIERLILNITFKNKNGNPLVQNIAHVNLETV